MVPLFVILTGMAQLYGWVILLIWLGIKKTLICYLILVFLLTFFCIRGTLKELDFVSYEGLLIGTFSVAINCITWIPLGWKLDHEHFFEEHIAKLNMFFYKIEKKLQKPAIKTKRYRYKKLLYEDGESK